MRVACILLAVAAAGSRADADVELVEESAMPSTDAFFFSETFEDGDVFGSGGWKKSGNDKYQGQPVSVELDSGVKDTSMLFKSANKHYGVGSKFANALDVTEKDFVVQYEVKLTEGLSCGGAYIKLLKDEPKLDIATMDNESPYVVMFGPDACGDTNKVHFILRHQNPISGEWEEKHAKETPSPRKDTKSHLYTLAIKADNSYEMFVDLESKAKGSLLEDMEPPVNPAKVIDDPNDSKPSDWVDEAQIVDPDATKPDDWDEDAPKKIPDMDATIPSDWLEEEADSVPDPSAKMPGDWDEEEDGEWEAPLVPNPKCKKVSGCGEWKRPEIENPEYKGKWSAPMIENPAYLGVWKPKQIDNPNYFVDEKPSNMARIGALAVEIWTTNGGIRMDNFLVDTDVDAALAFGKATWEAKSTLEAQSDVSAKKERARMAREKKREAGGAINMAQVYWGDAMEVANDNPIPAVITLIVLLFTLVFMCSGSSSKGKKGRPTNAAEEKVEEEEEDEDEDERDPLDVREGDILAEGNDGKAPTKKRTPKAE
eukprot:CAMPEP_0119510268 /NCGR_PEP_ID=MMETSP1344-20130328/29302_1 /TAXON_ID=236787 /ORGANISM="Florenciella parvula, Strain CCMP2471" /LENGTH=539 /DNA_ID=CAMNT_0007547179 /DNA_START=28 /DNA_END=1647 /DNA_ORIENTATION=+